MIAIRFDDENKAVNIVWACTAPQNNVWKYKKQKFSGVGVAFVPPILEKGQIDEGYLGGPGG